MADLWESLRGLGRGTMIAALSGTLGAVGGGYVSYRYAVEQTRAERFETSMLAEYQAIAASKKDLYAIIDKLTSSLAKGNQPDFSLVEAMNERLLDLHQRVDLFNIGLGVEDRAKITSVKTALAAIKVELAHAKSDEDLPYIASRVAEFETAFKAVEPIVEKQIGMPDQMLNG